MNEKNRATVQLLEAKTFFPLTLALLLVFGLFQNCSTSEFTRDVDPIEEQFQKELAAAVVIDGPLDVKRLEGTSLFITKPRDLFLDQGVKECTGADYQWTHTPDGAGAEQRVLSETSSLLQLNPIKLSDAGSYNLDVDCAGQIYNLGPVNVFVTPALRLVNSNIGDQTVNEGSPVSLNGEFEGPQNINYQWYLIQDSGSRLAIANQNTAELNIPSAELSDQGEYELEATSADGGFNQRVIAGPGRLTVLSMNSITGNVSGTTVVEENTPINLTSTVNGATNPEYQWYFNGVSVSGANSPNFEIPISQLSDEGVYAMRVIDNGEELLIGSIFVDVICPNGQGENNNSCVTNTQACNVNNGTGIQFLENSGDFGECTVVSCNAGYVNFNNSCLAFTGTCNIENGTGTYTIGSNGQAGDCVVSTCNTGYINLNNSCQQQSCPVENGVGLLTQEGENLVCEINYCYPNFVRYNDQCVPTRSTCSVENGLGYRDFTENGPGECIVQTCNNGFVNLNNECVSSVCNINNGQGVLAVASNGSVQCRAVSCNSGHILYGNQCISQSCSANGGTGFYTEAGGQLVCNLNQCDSNDNVVINNQCVSRTCSIANGVGSVAVDVNNQTYCRATSCNSGYVINNNTCLSVNGQPCPIENGTGLSANNGTTCEVQNCNSGYTAINNRCVREIVSCTIANGVGQRVYSSDGSYTCQLQSCNTGYAPNGNQCVPSQVSCNITNGSGYQQVFANGISQCVVESCDSGYGVTITQQCLPLRRPCYIGTGQGYQYLNSYGYSVCRVESCPSGQTEVLGVCRDNETLYCEPTDSSTSAYGGKVFGYLYSLVNSKNNVNINTAVEARNRVSGHVYLNKMSVNSSNTYLYDVSNQKARHSNGTYMKDWLGLQLYTLMYPPDGASSGNYILGIASDDGASLDCKPNGSWRTFVNNNSGSSCSTIKAASSAIYITRDAPMNVRVRYFQNSGSSRCLKLYYKRQGTNDSFREVPKSKLSLPFNTTNRCPNGSYGFE